VGWSRTIYVYNVIRLLDGLVIWRTNRIQGHVQMYSRAGNRKGIGGQGGNRGPVGI
jgi:hypothetical protein